MKEKEVLNRLVGIYSDMDASEKSMANLLGEDNIFSRMTGRIGDTIELLVFGEQKVSEELDRELAMTLVDPKLSVEGKTHRLEALSDATREYDDLVLPPPRFFSEEEKARMASNPQAYIPPAQREEQRTETERLKTLVTARENELHECANELCLHCGKYRNEHLGSCNTCKWLSVRRRLFE